MGYNKVILIGKLTADPVLRQTQGGMSICRFAIAVNRSIVGRDGDKREETCFVEIDSFGKVAENIAKYFSKGSPIFIEGRLRQDNWEDKETGKARSKIVVALERFEFLAPKDAGTRASAQNPSYGEDAPF